MANRFANPFEQMFSTAVNFLSGGGLYFYVTGSSTPATTYADSTLSTPNANPVPLDALGRHGAIFFDPSVTYKVILKDSDGNTIGTADPVADPAANVSAAFAVYPGNPSGNVAGNAGTVGGSGASVVWDITNHLLYVCQTTGSAASAVWSQIGATLAGQVLQSGVITPTTLAADTNDWNPTGLSGASVVRLQGDAAHNLTGIVAQPTGTILVLRNIGVFTLSLLGNNASSSAANRFLFPRPIQLRPSHAVYLRYDGVSVGWALMEMAPSFPIAGGFKNLKVQTTSNSLTSITADAITLEDGNGDAHRATTVSLAALDITTNGANGLDTGAAANTTWYSAWVIYNPTTNTVAGLLSTSATAPTMPSGYTFKARVGWVRTDGTAHLLRTLQYGRVAQYVIGTNPTVAPNIANGVTGTYSSTNPTLATASVTSVVPTATASRIWVVATSDYHGGAAGNVLVAPNTGWGGANNGPNGTSNQGWPLFVAAPSATGSGNFLFQQSAWMLLEAATIAWAADAAGNAISCLGWEDNL